MSDTPTVDQAFGSIPTSEEAFGPDKEQNHSGSFSDYFWSSTPSNRILSAFGQGLKNGWGAGPVGLSQETQDDLRKRGWFNDYNSGRTSILKSANEAWIRPIASTLDAALRAGSAALGGLAQGTYQTGKEIGQPKLGEAGAGIIEYLGTTGAPELALPHTAGIPAETLTRGRAEAVIGEGEHGYFNTKDASPEQIQDRAEATGSLPEEPVTAQKDIHQVAREIAPEVFSAYDEAKGYNNYYRNQLDVLKEAQPENPRVSELNTQIDDILSKVNGVEDKLTNKASDRLDSLRSELLDTPAKIDTEEMAVIRAKMMEHDYNMRDLAPDVAYAYRQAQEKLGSEAVEGPQETVPAQASTETPTSETASPGAPQTLLGGVPDRIKDQVSKQLIASGRPADEAEAAGQLLEAHYNARADRFKGKLGSGLELFNKEGPEVKSSDRGTKKGSLSINSSKNTIKLFNNADPSTFLHETGHQWLEELIQDGKHPEAPLELKSDVDSIRKWLRNDGEGITRKQHEQFARGFERYLMEGVAPSKELVSVFQKFKDWLTKIYQTVLNLKSPINDSIRDVFDRLITNNPEKTVVAPERDINEGPNDTAQSSSTVSQTTEEAVNKDNAPAVTSKAVSEQDKPIGGQDIIKDKSTPYVDKAGNINLDKITDNLDVKQTLRDITDQHPEITEATKGKISFKDQIDLAQAAGLKTSEINVEKLRAMSVEDGIPLSSRIYGLRQMLVQSSKNLFELMKGDDAVAYAEAVQRHIMIQQTVSGITAEVGRALGSFRIMADEAQKAQQLSEFLKANVGKTLYQLQDEMKLGKFLDTPDKVSGFVRDTNRASYGQMLLETFRNWLISGPITHATYALGNKLYAFYKAVPETTAQAIVGALHEAVAPLKEGELKRVTAGEVQEGLYTMLYAQKDGLKAAWDSFKAGQTLGLPGEGSIYDLAHRQAVKEKLEGQELTDRVEVLRKRYVTDMAYRQANKEGIPQMTPGGQDNPEYLRRVEDIINDPKSNDLIVDQKYTTPFTNTKAIPGALGTLIRIPGERMVAPLHSFDRTVGYLTNRNKFAFRQAVQEGLQGQDRAKRIIELQSDPDIMRRARNEATEQTLMGQSKSNFMRAVQGVLSWEADLPLLGETQPLKFISPFATVAANINRLAIIDRSPLGYLISKDLRDTINGKNGRFAQDEAIAKMGLGTAFYGTVGGLVLDGTVQPSADKDRNKARIDAVTKGLPHSIRVGEMSYALDRLGILGNMFGLAADMFEVARYAYDTHEYTKAGVAALHAIYNHVAEEGFMSGISDMLKAADEPDRYGGRWINNFLSTASVPFSVGSYQIARQIDPYQREVHGYIDSVKSKIPFVSETLPAKVDVFGNPVPSKEYYGVYAEHIDNDPAYQVLTQAGYFPAPVKDNIRGVKLTADQYHEYASKAGFLLKQQLDGIVSNENFSNLTAYTKHELIKEAITSSRSTAASIVQMKSINTDNDLIKKAIENQQNLIKGNK